jgi:hypothetical protein
MSDRPRAVALPGARADGLAVPVLVARDATVRSVQLTRRFPCFAGYRIVNVMTSHAPIGCMSCAGRTRDLRPSASQGRAKGLASRIEEAIPPSAVAGTRYDERQMRILDSER